METKQKIVEIVKQRRKSLPREGVRKLCISLKLEFDNAHLKVVRDTLFNILRKYNMLTLRKNQATGQQTHCTGSTSTRTLLKMQQLTDQTKYGSSDITYIRTVKGFCYLALITDSYSRKIIGYDISNSLELKSCVRALNKALYKAKDTPMDLYTTRTEAYSIVAMRTQKFLKKITLVL